MSLTRAIPDVAQPIAAFLRTETTLPRSTTSHRRELPTPIGGVPMNARLQVTRPLRFWIDGAPTCPMGLYPGCEKRDVDHPDAADAVLLKVFPINYSDNAGTADLADDARAEAFYAFMDWWDEQTDAKAAVAAIWG